MARKTYTTAVVLIPPSHLWPPIQAIRQIHDRRIRRWMPHITLIYPFRPHAEFDMVAERFASLCADIAPFSLVLTEIHAFRHRQDRHTLWLAPEPKEPIIHLQALLTGVIPDCDDLRRHRDGFTPHLTLGQIQGAARASELQRTLQADWQRLPFDVSTVSLIWRGEPPDDVFRVGRTVSLGTPP